MQKKILFRMLAVVSLLAFLGCTGSAGVKIKGYIDDKERVDQELTGGNAGYIYGTPQYDNSLRKETRKIYVLEMTKELEENNMQEDYMPKTDIRTEATTIQSTSRPQQKIIKTQEPDFELPSFDLDESDTDYMPPATRTPSAVKAMDDEPSPETYAVYTVQKNDTLQKISKKYYDSFSKWKRIYEANRLKIQDPDKLQPGTVLKIPVE